MMIMRAEDDEADDEASEGEREEVVGLVRRAGDVQEKDEVHAHLADREHGQQNRNAGMPHMLLIRRPE